MVVFGRPVLIHLHRVLGNATLTYEYLYTTLVQIESILNSRPLSPLSTDPNDFLPLTPAHFLIGKTLTCIPDQDLQNLPVNRLNKVQYTQVLMQHFWKRWSKEYINELQQRKKWSTGCPNLKLNDLVLIKEDNISPLNWLMERVINFHPGKDGIVRVTSVKTAKGDYTRPTAKLCPLPVQDQCSD